MDIPTRKTRAGLVLPGGGARGAFQVGVLQALADRLAEALLAQMAQPRAASLQACADEIVALIRSDMVAPYMRVWLEIVSKSTHGDPAFRATGHAIIEGFFAWLTNRLPEGTPDPETTGRAMLTLIEGTLVLDAVGHHEAADRARAHLFPIED